MNDLGMELSTIYENDEIGPVESGKNIVFYLVDRIPNLCGWPSRGGVFNDPGG